jgi:hypothetical protein
MLDMMQQQAVFLVLFLYMTSMGWASSTSFVFPCAGLRLEFSRADMNPSGV